jgi:hypothetical protein
MGSGGQYFWKLSLTDCHQPLFPVLLLLPQSLQLLNSIFIFPKFAQLQIIISGVRPVFRGGGIPFGKFDFASQ